MSDFQEYPDVVQEIRGALNPGRLKLQRNSVIFKNVKTGKVDQFQSSDIDKVQWLKRARGFCLKFVLNSGAGGIHRYDGFKEAEFDKLAKFISSYYSISLEKVDMSLKGWNWGTADFEGNALNFKVDNMIAFDIPLTYVMNSTTAKNEVTIEFHQNDDAAVSLMEVRFHIPPGPDTERDTVAEFHKNVMESADIIQISGESICTLSEVQCLTPRGRYDLKLFLGFLQLHGKTFDYKIPYQTILRLFLLPHKDGRQMYFVVSLDPPIKQGQTRYHFLILLFNKEDEMTLELSLSEEDIKTKYEDKLQKEMSGLEFEVVSKVFKAITGRKITVPGSFMGHSGAQAVSCSYKAATGLLYPLERGFIFVHKPPIHIRFDEVASVNFARSAGSTRSFDFEVDTNAGATFTFVGVEKDEYGKLYDFVKEKKLRVKNIGDKGSKTVSYNEMSDSDAEGGDHDAYLERMKAEGKDRDDDDSDDSSDESFNPGESGSEVAEEYDSNPPTTSDDSDSESSEGSSDGQDVGSDAEERRKAREEKRKEKEQKKKEKEEKKKEQKKEQKAKTAKTVKEGAPRKRKSGKGKDKDPNRPKRPQSAYFIWLNEHREQIKEENPGISITDLSKRAGEMWKEVTDKTEWDEKAKEAKADYQKAMEEYNKNKPSDSEGEEEESKPAKSKPQPKKKADTSTSGAGGGGGFKSKEYISSSGSDSSSSEGSDKPLKKIAKKSKKAESPVKSEQESAKSGKGSDSEEEKKEASASPASGSPASSAKEESGSGSE
ncbi:FACT complex subunit SSRP1 [Biomphalaria glabrata]|uniref:FACT complex subunit SSRP1 n=1 Tax=Biomphalaria glabrata TaxID=6526 RepID=A0A2C9KAU5_BIOGL|nr:FACT complex subunit SSRP1-like [Biomphalaria glabrata]KAI8753407.1 FACT complex subunit SSRP1-like [Biomphalaria glabrata]KAI8783219.1 FACT complex subunit SSRP1 [Biomphalaria glabrata]